MALAYAPGAYGYGGYPGGYAGGYPGGNAGGYPYPDISAPFAAYGGAPIAVNQQPIAAPVQSLYSYPVTPVAGIQMEPPQQALPQVIPNFNPATVVASPPVYPDGFRSVGPNYTDATQYTRYIHPFPRQRTAPKLKGRGYGLVDSWRADATPEQQHAWLFNPVKPYV